MTLSSLTRDITHKFIMGKMTDEEHNPLQCLTQLRQILSADKLSIGFFLGAGCPCAVRVPNETGDGDRPIIPDIKGLTKAVHATISSSDACKTSYETLSKTFTEDGLIDPTIEAMLNRIRSFREVAGKAGVSWLRLSEQIFRIDKWSLCRG
jgi:hypothetical protein